MAIEPRNFVSRGVFKGGNTGLPSWGLIKSSGIITTEYFKSIIFPCKESILQKRTLNTISIYSRVNKEKVLQRR
jgi:hypothetical protein